MQQSKLAARKAYSWAIRKRIPGFSAAWHEPELIEDAASHAAVAWYEIPEFERPIETVTMQVFLIASAGNYFRKSIQMKSRQVRPEDGQAWDAVWSLRSTYKTYNKATQELHIEAMQALNVIKQLPGELRLMALKMADGCNLPEAASELGLDLYAAMKRQKDVRATADRIINDGAVTGIFADPAGDVPVRFERNAAAEPSTMPHIVKKARLKKSARKLGNLSRLTLMIDDARRDRKLARRR